MALHKKKESKKQTISYWNMIDAGYVDDLTLHANTLVQDEYIPHSLKRAAVGIGFYVNPNKSVHVF